MTNIKSERNTNINMFGEDASYDVVNAENRLDFTHYPPLIYTPLLCIRRMELTNDLYSTVQNISKDIKVINLSSVCLVHLSVQPSYIYFVCSCDSVTNSPL